MTRHILVAPAGSRFSLNAGSEDGWVADIVTGVAAIDAQLRFTCVAEQTDGQFPTTIHPVAIGPRRTEELGGLLLPLRLDRAAGCMIPGDANSYGTADLLHHALPFSIGRTFSVLAERAVRRGLPVVVGPLQTPLEWTGPDEAGGQLMGQQGHLRQLVSGCATHLWPLAAGVLASASGRTLRQAVRVVAIGPFAAQHLEAAGVDPRYIAIIPPPVRSVVPTTVSERSPKEPLRLVTAGYLIERKGIDDIIAVVLDLVASGEHLVLEVAGDGPAAPMLRQLAGDHAGSVVRFHGWVKPAQLRVLFGSSHVYVSMSRGESWGQSVAEALASALVVVSSANTGARSMISLGAPIVPVPVGDRHRLAHELRRLCHVAPATLAATASDGARWASATLSTPVVARQWYDLYQSAMAETAFHPRAAQPVPDRR